MNYKDLLARGVEDIAKHIEDIAKTIATWAEDQQHMITVTLPEVNNWTQNLEKAAEASKNTAYEIINELRIYDFSSVVGDFLFIEIQLLDLLHKHIDTLDREIMKLNSSQGEYYSEDIIRMGGQFDKQIRELEKEIKAVDSDTLNYSEFAKLLEKIKQEINTFDLKNIPVNGSPNTSHYPWIERTEKSLKNKNTQLERDITHVQERIAKKIARKEEKATSNEQTAMPLEGFMHRWRYRQKKNGKR